jgi:hypothetical protein
MQMPKNTALAGASLELASCFEKAIYSIFLLN